MNRKEYKVKQCKANDLECILLYSLLCIPNEIAYHPKFRRLIIVDNPITNKTRLIKGKPKKVNYYCSIDIDAKLDNVLDIFKDNPFFMDYNVFEKVNNPISGKKTGNFITTYSTHLLFWIPSDKEKEKYEQI